MKSLLQHVKPATTLVARQWLLWTLLFYILICAEAAQDYDLGSLAAAHGFVLSSRGSAVSAAGDVNGDGIDDVIVGASWVGSNTGVAYVLFGSKGGSFANIDLATFTDGPTIGFRLSAAAAGDNFGRSVSKAGDVNGDGVDDIIIGAPAAQPSGGKANAGISYVIFGRKVTVEADNAFTVVQMPSSALAAHLGFRILGDYAADHSGVSVSDAGDMNGDGIDDVIVGAYLAESPNFGASNDAGIAYVIFGKNMTGNTAAFGDVDLSLVNPGSIHGFRIIGAEYNDYCGSSVSRAGDINGDGMSDVIVGAHRANHPGFLDIGIAYVIFGRKVTVAAGNAFSDIQLTSTAVAPGVGFRMLGASAGAWCGYSVSAAGDVNGDDIDDVIVGAIYDDPPELGVNNDAGISYVVFGQNKTVFTDVYLSSVFGGTSVGFRILGAAVADNSGSAVSAVGDVNNDGVDDIIVGALNADPTVPRVDAGMSYVIFGRKSVAGSIVFDQIHLSTIAATSQTGFLLLGAATNDQSGYSVSGAGDFNGDGVDDILVGTYLTSSYLVYGSIASPTSQPSSQPSDQPSQQPSTQPTRRPSLQPTTQPSVQPSRQPTAQPSTQPASAPTAQPSRQPSGKPSGQPTRRPSAQPSEQPSSQPSGQPSTQPSSQPRGQPSSQPTGRPSAQPSRQSTIKPSAQPSNRPTGRPSTQPTLQPSAHPTTQPSNQPSHQPSSQPSFQPSGLPSVQPSAEPTAKPSAQPSMQPTSKPSVQPSMHPSAKPSTQPSTCPTSGPSAQPSCRPSAQPTAKPSTQPSELPSARPSAQPSSQPSARPSWQPSSQPSTQPNGCPSVQPTTTPSTQPTRQPITQPSSQPSGQPTSTPSMQPSSRPSTQPASLPSIQLTIRPSSKPTAGPSALPSGQPSVHPTNQDTAQPSSLPTIYPTTDPFVGTWATKVNSLQSINAIGIVKDTLWACGRQQTGCACAVMKARTGLKVVHYAFAWTEGTAVLQTANQSQVFVSGRSVSQNAPTLSHVVQCESHQTQRICSGVSFYDVHLNSGTYVPITNKIMYVGTYNAFTSATIIDAKNGVANSYTYSFKTIKSITLHHVLSPPNYVGAFVAGTGVSTSGAANYFIVAGIVRTDSGSMTAMHLAPVSDSIVNSAELVNAMALEYEHPDSFIAGGLQLSDGAGLHAYLLRVNAFFGSIRYVVRYRADSGDRRVLSGTIPPKSIVKGMVRVSDVLYLIADVTRNSNSNNKSNTSLTVLKVNVATGLILQQVQVSSPNASLSCTGITTSTTSSVDVFLYIACTVWYNTSFSETIVIATDSQLQFAKLPLGFIMQPGDLFRAEGVPFKQTTIAITGKIAPVTTERFVSSITDHIPTLRPSVTPTTFPTGRPSSFPSGQPSSSPTATPSVSPQPTSHPSSSGPTNTNKPTVKPTQRPSVLPSKGPTVAPSLNPTIKPTARPTVKPSTDPSTQPSVTPTTSPTRTTITKPSLKPTAVPIPRPTQAPSSAGTSAVPEVVTSKSGQSSSDAAMIFLYVVAGLIGLWCVYRLLKYYIQTLLAREKTKVLREDLDKMRLFLTDQPPLPGPTLPTRRKKKRRDYVDGASLEGHSNNIPIGASADSAPVGAFATGPIRADKSSLPAGPVVIVEPVTLTSASVGGSSSSSSIVVSSLHSSEMSDISYSAYSAGEMHFNEDLFESHSVSNSESAMEEGRIHV